MSDICDAVIFPSRLQCAFFPFTYTRATHKASGREGRISIIDAEIVDQGGRVDIDWHLNLAGISDGISTNQNLGKLRLLQITVFKLVAFLALNLVL
jgi:hypothetical protein